MKKKLYKTRVTACPVSVYVVGLQIFREMSPVLGSKSGNVHAFRSIHTDFYTKIKRTPFYAPRTYGGNPKTTLCMVLLPVPNYGPGPGEGLQASCRLGAPSFEKRRRVKIDGIERKYLRLIAC